MAKYRECPFCGDNLIKIASSYWSCTNKYCKYFFNFKEYDNVFIDNLYYGDEIIRDFSMKNIDNDYRKDYDDYLFFSNHPNYISRYEYRRMNNFIEDYLFKDYKRAKFSRFIDDKEVSNINKVKEKYELINKGRNLEDISSKEAFEYYKSIKHYSLFENDYYIYKKLVKLAGDYETQLNLIIEFFCSGIYCNRYNYIWFLKKLNQVCKNIDVSKEVIDEALYNFKNHGFNNKINEDSPVVLAEKITSQYGEVKVRTEEQYAYEQFKYELSEEISQLNYHNQYEYMIYIFKKLLLDYNFKSVRFYEGICINYHRINEYENECKWIYRYLTSASRYKSDDSWCKSRLDNLNVFSNTFKHDKTFFDYNEHYLNENDFKNNPCNNFEIRDYLNSVKEKYFLMEEGLNLERDPLTAIDYYTSLLTNDLFKNDYYLYKVLVILYDEIEDYESELETLISFFESEIYCDRFNYLFFLYHLSKLYSLRKITYDDADYYMEFFKNHGFKNKNLENNPAPIAERIIYNENELFIISGQDFSNNQYRESLNLELNLYDKCKMFYHANDVCRLLIGNYNSYPIKLYKRLCINYRKINDFENELKTIDEFLDEKNKTSVDSKKWFVDRREKLVKKMEDNPNPNILSDPEIEIFFENNENYLSFYDFKENEIENTELLDKIRAKQEVRRHGYKLEHDFKEASEYYNSFLGSELFKNDYYIYRRLVLVYSFFGEFELVYKTIKDFFSSGIYCNRYQYLWFLHKLNDVSKVKYISDDEISNMLCAFKNNGFKNNDFKGDLEIATERFRKSKTSILISSYTHFDKKQKDYELKEEITQLEINGNRDKSAKILRKVIDNNDFTPAKSYMRLCHTYRENGEYENEKELIEEYLSENDYSKEWFENRLKELDELMK